MNYPILSKTIKYLLGRNVDVDPRILILCPELGSEFAKTYEFFLRTMTRLIRSVYEGNLGGDFIDIAGNLIDGQLRRAYEEAWKEEGTGGDMPAYLIEALEAMVADQQSYLEGLYKDIVDARVDSTPIEPLLSRAEMWANQYNTAYNDAVRYIVAENGGRLVWKYDPDKEHCTTCAALNGIVAYAAEWEELGVHPAGGPNPVLECNGYRCGCSLEPTEKRRSPKAYDTILNAVTR